MGLISTTGGSPARLCKGFRLKNVVVALVVILGLKYLLDQADNTDALFVDKSSLSHDDLTLEGDIEGRGKGINNGHREDAKQSSQQDPVVAALKPDDLLEPLPSWARKPISLNTPEPAQQCLSNTLRASQGKDDSPYLPMRDFGQHPIVVVTVTPGVFDEAHQPKCDVPCYHMRDSGQWALRADAFMKILYIADYGLPFSHQCSKTQRNFDATIEGELNYPHLYSNYQFKDEPPEGGPGRDQPGSPVTIQSNVRFESDPPTAYIQWYPSFYEYDSIKLEERPVDAIAVISNCADRQGRGDYIRQLRAAVPDLVVEVWGRCGEKGPIPGPPSAKHDVIRKAKFVFAFENSASKDYVTEKFFHALEVGAVPVVFHTPNIRDFEPGPMSIVSADDYQSPGDLGQYLLRLSRSPSELMRYHEWRKTGGTPKFRALMDTQAVTYMCRVCIAMADKWVRRQDPATLHPPYDHILVRERNTFYFRVIPDIPKTVPELHAAIVKAFDGYVPVWACSAGDCPNMILDVGYNVTFNDHPRQYHGAFEIYSVYPAYSTQEEAQRKTAIWYNTDERVGSLTSGARLEVIFV